MSGGGAGDSEAAYKSALADFAADLKRLHVSHGEPSLGELVKRAAEAGEDLSLAGISEIFTGKRFPKLPYTIRLIHALTDEPEVVSHWRERWEKVADLRQAAKSRPATPDPGSDASTGEREESRSREEWLSDDVESFELRAQAAEARADDAEKRADTAEKRADAADRLVARLQETLYRYWPANGVPLASPKAGRVGPVLSIAFHPNGSLLAAGYGDGSLTVWDTDRAETHGWSRVNKDNRPVHSVAFSPAGDILAVGSADGGVRLVRSGARQFYGPLTFIEDSPIDGGPEIRSVVFGPSDLLAAGDEKGTVHVWQSRLDGESRTAYEPFYKHQCGGPVRSLAFMPDRRLLALGTGKGRDSASTADLLDFDSYPGERQDMRFSGSPVLSVAFSRNGDLLAIAEDRTVHLKSLNYSGPSGTDLHTFITCNRGIHSLAFNPEVDHLAIGTGKTCALYRVRPGYSKREREIKVNAAACSLAFRPDGKLLAIGRADGVVQLYGPGAHQI